MGIFCGGSRRGLGGTKSSLVWKRKTKAKIKSTPEVDGRNSAEENVKDSGPFSVHVTQVGSCRLPEARRSSSSCPPRVRKVFGHMQSFGHPSGWWGQVAIILGTEMATSLTVRSVKEWNDWIPHGATFSANRQNKAAKPIPRIALFGRTQEVTW